MDDHTRNTYLREAQTQCAFALNAVGGLNSVMSRLPAALRAGDHATSETLHQEVFRSLHSFLTHASNVSRLFWPAAPRRQRGESRPDYRTRCSVDPRLVRGTDLRTAIGLPPHAHALRSRRIRDHLEHFDERLDDWQATSTHRNYVQDYIGPTGGISGIDPTDMMRWYDPDTKFIRFRGEEYDLQKLVDGVADVARRIHEFLAKKEEARFTRRMPRSSEALQPTEQ